MAAFGKEVVTAMTGNVNFTNPVPAVQELATATKNLSDAIEKARSREKLAVSVKNDMRIVLQQLLVELANYVNYTAAPDRSKLISSGLKLTGESRNKHLGTVENFTVTMGKNSGEVILKINSVENSKSYLHCYSPHPVTNDAWIHAVSSSAEYQFEGLEPLKLFDFKSGALGSKGQMVYSAIITKGVV